MNFASDNEPPSDPVASASTPSAAGSAEADRVCAEQARDGDTAAMARLVEQHQDAIARLLWRFARTPADLDDLVQETFLRMVRGLAGWRAEQPFAHWLLRIATNVGRDYFRRHAVRRRWLAEPVVHDDSPQPEAIDPSGDPAARAAAEEVKTILAQLAPDDRALLTLHHLEGWPLADIAAQFGWTVTATKLRAWRARRQLRSFLESRDPS